MAGAYCAAGAPHWLGRCALPDCQLITNAARECRGSWAGSAAGNRSFWLAGRNPSNAGSSAIEARQRPSKPRSRRPHRKRAGPLSTRPPGPPARLAASETRLHRAAVMAAPPSVHTQLLPPPRLRTATRAHGKCHAQLLCPAPARVLCFDCGLTGGGWAHAVHCSAVMHALLLAARLLAGRPAEVGLVFRLARFVVHSKTYTTTVQYALAQEPPLACFRT